ncbi:MAG: hypothetical protein R3C56_24645 [Pirellulaceae bacterium]
MTILLEHTLPSVFPWKLGFMLLEWPWWLQAVDTFGASYSTFIVFAMAGLVINLGMFFGLPRAAANTTSQATTNTSAHGHYPFFVLVAKLDSAGSPDAQRGLQSVGCCTGPTWPAALRVCEWG